MSNSHRFLAIADSLTATYDAAESLAKNGGPVRPFLAIAPARDDILSKGEVIRDGIATAVGFLDLAEARRPGPDSLPGSASVALRQALRTVDYTQAVLTQLSLTVTGWANDFRREDGTLDDMLFQLAWNVAKWNGTLDDVRRVAERRTIAASKAQGAL